jgi:O-antigen ligase
VINRIHSRDGLVFILVLLLVGLILESLIIVLMQVVGRGFSFAGIMGNIYAESTSLEGVSRIGGTLISANTAGSYLSMLLVPAFSIMLTKLKKPYKWLGLIAFTCGAIALILTGSRGAWLAAFISFVIFGIVSFRRGWLDLRIVVIGAVIGILIGLAFYTPIYDRIFGYDAGAAAGRIPQYQVAFQIIKDHPFFGVGANNYPVIQPRYLGYDSSNKVFRWAVHNKYLLVWAETGFLGLLFFVLFLISTLRQGFKIARIEDHLLSPLALGFTAAIAGQMVHMFFDVFHSRPQVQLLWLIAGLLLVMSYVQFPAKNFQQ